MKFDFMTWVFFCLSFHLNVLNNAREHWICRSHNLSDRCSRIKRKSSTFAMSKCECVCVWCVFFSWSRHMLFDCVRMRNNNNKKKIVCAVCLSSLGNRCWWIRACVLSMCTESPIYCDQMWIMMMCCMECVNNWWLFTNTCTCHSVALSLSLAMRSVTSFNAWFSIPLRFLGYLSSDLTKGSNGCRFRMKKSAWICSKPLLVSTWLNILWKVPIRPVRTKATK